VRRLGIARATIACAALAVVVALGLVLLRPDEPADDKKSVPKKKAGDARLVIEVRTARELIAAIGSERVIRLAPGEYVLPYLRKTEAKTATEYVSCPGYLVLHDLRNLTIEGLGEKKVQIVSEMSDAPVLVFRDSTGIELRNIEAGHTAEVCGEPADVLTIENCRDIRVEDCVLYGTGSVGLRLKDVDGFEFVNSEITDCSLGIMTVTGSRRLAFRESRFHSNRSYKGIAIRGSTDVFFGRCEMTENNAYTGDPEGGVLFDVDSSENVRVTDSRISGNTLDYFIRRPGTVRFSNCVMEKNEFRKDKGTE